MFFTPSSFARLITASDSSGATWPVASDRFSRDDLQHLLGLGKHLAARRDPEPFAGLLENLVLVVGVEGRQPYHLAAAAGHAVEPFDRGGIHAAHRAVERDSAHALAGGDARDFEVVEAAVEHVGIAVNVDVDRARRGAHPRRRRRKTGLCEQHDGKRERGRAREDSRPGLEPLHDLPFSYQNFIARWTAGRAAISSAQRATFAKLSSRAGCVAFMRATTP